MKHVRLVEEDIRERQRDALVRKAVLTGALDVHLVDDEPELGDADAAHAA